MHIKLKPNFFFENQTHFNENAMILTCVKIQKKMFMSGEVGAPENYFWD